MTSTYRIGDTVRNPKALEWGRGKVVAIDGSKVHAFFEHVGGRAAKAVDTRFAVLERLAGERVPLLDALPPITKAGSAYSLPAERVTLRTLVERFLTKFPGAFAGPKFMAEERDYKIAAHATFVRLFGDGAAETLVSEKNGVEIARRIHEVVAAQNLMATQEIIALTDALKAPDAAIRYLAELMTYLAAPTVDAATFRPYCVAVQQLPKVGALRVVTWPVATLLPYLAQPTRHMFLKPTVTKAAAEAMGVDLRYSPEPNWDTYKRLLDLSGELFRVLEPLGARDFIDVQSFVWRTLSM
jgi:hypothetical protein